MNTNVVLVTLFACVLVGSCLYAQQPDTKNDTDPSAAAEPNSVLGFSVEDIKGNTVSLDEYKGRALLLVNVASKCGLTNQYAQLVKLHSAYKERGLEILAFPANDFNNQEPGSNAEILAFCTTRFDVGFPMFAKISVAGEDIAPLYDFLTSEEHNPEFSGPIQWNFTKFLVNHEGKVVNRFAPRTSPDADEVVQAIEKALPPV